MSDSVFVDNVAAYLNEQCCWSDITQVNCLADQAKESKWKIDYLLVISFANFVRVRKVDNGNNDFVTGHTSI